MCVSVVTSFRASMPSLSVVSPLDVLRETQTNRLLADRINANNAFLSRIGKRGNDGAPNFLQVLFMHKLNSSNCEIPFQVLYKL